MDGNFAPREKRRNLDELSQLTQGLRRQGKTVVWTNGCFEILHAGQIEFLIKAAGLADVFIVGVNSDASVAALKGKGHPLAALDERLLVLSAVQCIDYLTVFDEPNCANMLRALQPDVYAKGMRHLHGNIDEEERAVVEAAGGCVALIAGDPAKSTSAIIEKIRGDR